MKKITDKDVEHLKAGKKITKGFIHMQLDDKGRLNLWSDINITDNYRSLKIDANKLFDHGEDFNYAKSVYYQVFLTDSKEVIQNMMHGIIYGKWTFVKRGENFGIKLIKVLPKIHKISLDMIAKDIFRSENK